ESPPASPRIRARPNLLTRPIPTPRGGPPFALARVATIRYLPPTLTDQTGVRRLAGNKGPTVTVTVRQLAEWVRGEVLGDADRPISNARTLADAQPGDITFVEDDKHLGAWHASRASAAVVPVSVPVNGRPIIRVGDPLMAFVSIVRHLRGRPAPSGPAIDP